MRNERSGEEEPAAGLVGSLTAFSVSEVLTMLATTLQSGELQVVDENVDGKIWLIDGQLSNAHVGAATTIGQAVFELACITAGWFYFTPGIISSSGQPAVPVAAVLGEVRPLVDEWKELRAVVPLDAELVLAPNPPGADVQIRSDQWRVLATVGSGGLTVRQVLDRIEGDQVVGLRTVRDLHAAGLVELGTAPLAAPDLPAAVVPTRRGAQPDPRSERPDGAVAAVDVPDDSTTADSDPALPATPAASDATVPTGDRPEEPRLVAPPPPLEVMVEEDRSTGTLAGVTIMPPPIATDPWAPTFQTSGTTSNGTGDNGAA